MPQVVEVVRVVLSGCQVMSLGARETVVSRSLETNDEKDKEIMNNVAWASLKIRVKKQMQKQGTRRWRTSLADKRDKRATMRDVIHSTLLNDMDAQERKAG